MAYLILAHDNRAGLDHLLQALLPAGTEDFAIVHADAGSALWRDLSGTAPGWDARVHLLPDPVKARWGHWTLVEAARRLIDAALARGCDFAHLLSGADWPVARREQILADIARHPHGTCFIEAEPLIQEERMQHYRFDTRWLRIDPGQDRLTYTATWELRRLTRVVAAVRETLGLERSRPFGPWHKGSQWWSLPVPALKAVASDLAMLRKSGRLSGTVCADEHAIQTAITHRFGASLAPNRRFAEFPPGQSSPRLLTAADLPAIRASGAWFARKVASAADPFFEQLP